MAPNTRRRQQRITFTPLPASSSQAEGYHKQIQDRAAAVGYGDSTRSSKRRKLQPTAIGDDNAAFQETNANDMLPTPAEDVQANEDEPVRSSQRASKRRAKQQRLDFGPPSSNGVNLDPPTGQTMFKQRGQKRAAEPSSEDSDDLPSPGKQAKRAKKSAKKRNTGFMSSRGSKDARSSQPEKEKEPTPQEDTDEDEVVLPSARKARRQPQQTIEEEDSEDEMPTTLGTQKRRRQERQSSFISSSPPAATDGSDDDLQIIDDPKGKGRATRAQDTEDSGDEDLPTVTPRKRLLKRRGKFSKEEQDDLDEDLQFLGPSSDGEEPGRAPRSSQSTKKNARQQALERYRQVRSSQRTLADIQEDQEEAHFPADQRERDEMYDNSEESPEPGPTSSRAMFDADEDDEDFIEEGDDDTLGVPDGIPLKFTRYGSMKAKELWKFAIEWMVQKKINPAFAMDDEIYELTFKKLDDEVSGLADSKFQSSAWKNDFTTALRARPEIQENPTDIELDKCDACNRSRHPVKYRVQFMGKPYHRSTLEEVGKDDDDDDEEDDSNTSDSDKPSNDDNPSYDAQGREIAPANTVWYVGKFCMANARTAHALQHWRYHLYEWVVIWIDGHGYSTPKKLKKRDKMSTKKRRKEANKIVDRMVDEGVVKQLWKEFRGTIDDAANSKQGRFEVNSP